MDNNKTKILAYLSALLMLASCKLERHGRVYDKIYESPYTETVHGTSYAGKVPSNATYDREVRAKYFITMIIINDRDTLYRDYFVDEDIYNYFKIGDSISFNWIKGFKKY